jgi:hypothetical protein
MGGGMGCYCEVCAPEPRPADSSDDASLVVLYTRLICAVPAGLRHQQHDTLGGAMWERRLVDQLNFVPIGFLGLGLRFGLGIA